MTSSKRNSRSVLFLGIAVVATASFQSVQGRPNQNHVTHQSRALLLEEDTMNGSDSMTRLKWLGEAIDDLGVLFWTKNADGEYTAVNQFYADTLGSGSPTATIGKTDFEITLDASNGRALKDYKDRMPGETLESIAADWRSNDLEVQSAGAPMSFIERVTRNGKFFSVVSIKSPFLGGTTGICIPLHAGDFDYGWKVDHDHDDDGRLEWLGRAVDASGFYFWTKDSLGAYTATNEFFISSNGDEIMDSTVIGKTDVEIFDDVLSGKTILLYKNRAPGETKKTIAMKLRANDVKVQEKNKSMRFMERVVGDKEIMTALSVKSPFMSGTCGVGVNVDQIMRASREAMLRDANQAHENMKESRVAMHENVKETATAMHENVKDARNTMLDGTQRVVGTVYNSMKSLHEGVKDGVERRVEDVKEKHTSMYEGARDAATAMHENVKETATAMHETVKDARTSKHEEARAALDAVKDLHEEATSTLDARGEKKNL